MNVLPARNPRSDALIHRIGIPSLRKIRRCRRSSLLPKEGPHRLKCLRPGCRRSRGPKLYILVRIGIRNTARPRIVFASAVARRVILVGTLARRQRPRKRLAGRRCRRVGSTQIRSLLLRRRGITPTDCKKNRKQTCLKNSSYLSHPFHLFLSLLLFFFPKTPAARKKRTFSCHRLLLIQSIRREKTKLRPAPLTLDP